MDTGKIKSDVAELISIVRSIDPNDVALSRRKSDSIEDCLDALAPFALAAFPYDSAINRPRAGDGEIIEIAELGLKAPLLKTRRVREVLGKCTGYSEVLPDVAVKSEVGQAGSIDKIVGETVLKVWVDPESGNGARFKAFIEVATPRGRKCIDLSTMSLGWLLQQIEFVATTHLEDLISSDEVEGLIRLHLQIAINQNLTIDGDDFSEFMTFVGEARGAWQDSRPMVVRAFATRFPVNHAYRLAAMFDAMRLGDTHGYRVLTELIPGYVAPRRYAMSDLVADSGEQLYTDRWRTRTEPKRTISVLSDLEEFQDFGSGKVCWRFLGEFIGGGKGTFVIQDASLTKAFPDYINAVWGQFAVLWGRKTFVIDDIA